MIRHWGKYEVRLIWNWPVFTFTYLRAVFRPEDDPRAWYLRWRVGPYKIEVIKTR